MLKLIRRLNVSHKLTLVSVSFLIPDFVLLCLFLVTINGYIEFAEQERRGNEYLRPLEALLDDLPQHEQLALRQRMGESSSAELRIVQARLDATFHRLLAVDARLGESLQFTTDGLTQRHREAYHPTLVAQEWNRLRDQLDDLDGATCAAQHGKLITAVRTMISHAGDTSNLILDPDLDSYYLMDMTLLALPQMQERLGAVLLHGEACLRRGLFSSDDRNYFKVHAAMLQEADLDRVALSARTALNEDQAFYGTSDSLQHRLPAALEAFVATEESFIALASRLAEDDPSDVRLAEFLAVGAAARRATFDLWKLAAEELDGLLQTRIDHYKRRRAASLALAALAFTAAVSLVTFITRSISRPLQRQADELRQANVAIQNSERELKRLYMETQLWLASISSVLIHLDPVGIVTRWNATAESVFGIPASDAIGRSCRSLPWRDGDVATRIEEMAGRCGEGRFPHVVVKRWDGREQVLDLTVNPICDDGKCIGLLVLGNDRTEQVRLEENLRQSQKLEAVGSLAAGIAHEINTPLQFVLDNTCFLRDSFANIERLLKEYEHHSAESALTERPMNVDDLDRIRQAAKADYLLSEIPAALSQSLDGLERVTTIVRATKEFSHPAKSVKSLHDVNRTIESTVLVTRHEWKYVADVKLELQPDLPDVPCHPEELNQVLLNLVVNAAHAIGDVVESGKSERGTITISTRQVDDDVEIRVADTGSGIPEDVGARIFDPFFTTKSVGKGTGQGLTIARSIVVDKHGGSISFESEVGSGTTFVIRLPLNPAIQGSEEQVDDEAEVLA